MSYKKKIIYFFSSFLLSNSLCVFSKLKTHHMRLLNGPVVFRVKMSWLCRDAIQAIFYVSWHSICSRDCWCLRPTNIHRKSPLFRVPDVQDRQDFVRNASRRIQSRFPGVTAMQGWSSIVETNEPLLPSRITVNGMKERVKFEINGIANVREHQLQEWFALQCCIVSAVGCRV